MVRSLAARGRARGQRRHTGRYEWVGAFQRRTGVGRVWLPLGRDSAVARQLGFAWHFGAIHGRSPRVPRSLLAAMLGNHIALRVFLVRRSPSVR